MMQLRMHLPMHPVNLANWELVGDKSDMQKVPGMWEAAFRSSHRKRDRIESY
jgi:hypothetical protein